MTIFRFVPALAALFALTVMEASPTSAQGPDLAAQVREKAALSVSQFQARAGGRLDCSEQSLATVEEMLAEASEYAKEMPAADVKALVELMGLTYSKLDVDNTVAPTSGMKLGRSPSWSSGHRSSAWR